MTLENIEIFVLERPDTVLHQYRRVFSESKAEWVLIKDRDSEILSWPVPPLPDWAQFVSFRQENVHPIFGSAYMGIGMYRVKAIKEVLKEPTLSSVGLDLYLRKHLVTLNAPEATYRHDFSLTHSRMYRYGKGRAYYAKSRDAESLPRADFNARYLTYYGAYFAGYMVGLCTTRRDSNW